MTWDRLCQYVDTEMDDHPDGLFLAFPDTVLGNSVVSLAANCKRLCETLVLREYQNPEYVESVSYLEGLPEWQLKIRKVGFFVLAFGSFYPSNHPRHAPVTDTSLLLFQPQSSFDTIIPDYKIERQLRVSEIFAKKAGHTPRRITE